jgi:cytochrome c oxidase cbb3-type subunit 3
MKALVFLLLVACTKKEDPSDTSGALAASSKAREVFDTRCSVCHGSSGKGDGPGAINIVPKPRNYTDKTWQASVTDDQLKKAIAEGGQAVGKSNLMPANPDLKPEVVDELVKIVRSFGK